MARRDVAGGWRGALAVFLCAFAFQAIAADVVREQVIVSGVVKNALTLKVDKFKAFPAEQIVSVTGTRRVDDKGGATTCARPSATAAPISACASALPPGRE